MKVIKCDACGEICIPVCDRWDCNVVLTTANHANQRFDLCPKCAEKIEQFIRNAGELDEVEE